MYDGLDMIDDILNARGEIAIADVMLALGVLHWSRVLLKTRLSADQAGAAREWPLERLYLRLSIKMGPILISIDDLRIREGIEQLFSSVFVDLLEDLCMLIERNHARPVSMVVEMLRMLFRIAPKAGITHRAADLLTLLAQAAARISGRLLSAFVLACRDLSTLQPQNHPLVIAACQALLAIAPENDRPGKNYQPPISRPSSNKPYEPALQRLEQLIADVSLKQREELALTAALARIDLSFIGRVVKGVEEDCAKEGIDADMMKNRYVIALLYSELPDYPRPLVAFFALGDTAGHHEEMKGGYPHVLLKKEEDNKLLVHPDFPVSPSTVLFTVPGEVDGVSRLQAALHRSGGAYDVALIAPSLASARIWHLVGDLDPTGNLYEVETRLLPAGNDEAALNCLDSALKSQPWLSGALVQKGLIAKRAGDMALARSLFMQAITLQPHDPIALTRMGVLEKNENELEKCSEYLLKSLKILPVQSSAMITLGANMLTRLAAGDSSALPVWDYYIAGLHAAFGDGPDFLEFEQVSATLDPKLAKTARTIPVDTVFYL
jgi:tetratricopeptide (TPR) repeat protein